jgi:sulfur carrier protein
VRRVSAKLTVKVNGEPRELPEGSTLSDLLAAMGVESARVAVERNRDIVPRARHPETRLAEGDELEVVHFVGGG